MQTRTTERGTEYIVEPLSRDDVRKLADGYNRIVVNVCVDVDDLLNHTLDEFNDVLDEKVLVSGVLAEIDFKMIDVEKNNELIVQVDALVDDYEL